MCSVWKRNQRKRQKEKWTHFDESKYVGEWREGKPWNITIYGKSGIIIMKYVNGVEQE